MLTLILLVFAFVLALIEALWPSLIARARPHLGWLAIALWILVELLSRGGGIVR